MVSGLNKGTLYEERLKKLELTTLEERRHRLDMMQTYKIVSGKGEVSEMWFKMAGESSKATKCSRTGDKKEFLLTETSDGWTLAVSYQVSRVYIKVG